ncbi:MAG: peptidase M22 [Clostridia bacterium]|nr:peptidase M22 [Clostridia bacterium]
MANKVFVGVDTSNYTTSVAICDYEGNILHNFKMLLPVKNGERGLRQSDAVFAHIKNLQKISDLIRDNLKDYEIVAIGYSAFPRDVEGSYMPCFLVGESVAKMVAALNNIPIFHFSHQAGHIRSAVYSSGVVIENEDFIAFHVSGGTTEVVKVTPNGSYYGIDIVGGSNDLHAGQAIDRIGVYMGMDFPCGKEMESYAKNNTKKIPQANISVKDFSCNLSGLENLAIKLYESTMDKELTCAFVFDFLGKVLEKITSNIRKEYSTQKIVYGGGVLSNSIIKNRLNNKFSDVYFAEPQFSSDNASGTALLTMEKYFDAK